ncbi:hypothetical protein CR155_04165 [Pollutimonas nitritireducens]|uniref:YgjP-like metallopeptidase domain-containing protein n=1 Tax=Pollutimonas nitritireducens TaxID=2045209 RepID=A0A2N4UK49_9BURK|nr:hypothetical protein CR155_04165 [Pollutimonas nitritireducens]
MDLTEQLTLFSDSPACNTAPQPAPMARAELTVTTTCPPALPSNARWREVKAAQQTIGYVLQRSRRKSIGLTVNDDGLQVTAPNWVTLSQIDTTVIEKASWILGKLRIRQARQQHQATAATLWQDGGTIPYLGTHIVLKLDGTQKTPLFLGTAFSPMHGDVLSLALPAAADRNRIRDSVHAWLQQQALAWFGDRLQHFLDATQLKIRRWRLSSAATRWGSCSSDGNIMLNWRLIHFEHAIIDYVIAHELAHLRHMNHSKEFWREVGLILPGFEPARNALRQHDPSSLPLI